MATTSSLSSLSSIMELSVEIPPSNIVQFTAEDECRKSKKSRCCFTDCKKRLTSVDKEMMCRCGFYYCGAHRHSEDHKCTYDFRSGSVAHLQKQLVKCAADSLYARI